MSKTKERLTSLLLNLKKHFLSAFKTKRVMLLLLSLTIGLSFFIISGAFYPGTQALDIGFRVSELVKNNNTGYLPIFVESRDEENTKLRSTAAELYNVYGTFREERITFAGTGNVDKKHQIFFEEIQTDNLSFLYVDANSNYEYNGAFRHEYYPIDLMFKGDFNPYDAYTYCYISESQANKIMKEKGIQTYDEVIGLNLTLNVNQTLYTYKVADIFYERNYYYDGLASTIGEFIISSPKFPLGISKQATYFLNKYQYQNAYFLKYLRDTYDVDDYAISFDISKFAIPETILKSCNDFFARKNDLLLIPFVVFLMIGIGFFAFSAFLTFKLDEFQTFYNFPLISLFALTPYIIFKITYEFVKNTYLFSQVGLGLNLVGLVLFFSLFVFLVFYKKYKKDQYEKIG